MRTMTKTVGRTSRLVGWGMILVLGVLPSLICVSGPEMTQAQKACCVAMGHDCGPMAREQDCCSI